MYRRLLIVGTFFSALFFAGGILAQEQGSESEVEEKNARFERLAPADRPALRRFEQAKRLIEADREAEAAQLLGSILESEADFFLPPPADDVEDDEEAAELQTSHRLFHDLVFDTLQGLPSQARESYLLQYETQARRLLDNAVQAGSFEGVQSVAKRYFLTSSGAEASMILGLEQMERGAFAAATRTMENLRRSHHSRTDFEPTLSLSLALCQLHLNRMEDATQTVQRFWQRFPRTEVLLSGEELWKPETAEEIFARLKKAVEADTQVAISAWLERTGWLLRNGTAAQTPETLAERPLLEKVWGADTLNKADYQDASRTVARQVEQESGIRIPASQPLIVQNKLLARGVNEIFALDIDTGKLLWTAPEPEYDIPRQLQPHVRRQIDPFQFGGETVATMLRLNFWHDPISQQLSSDGGRLFSIEGHDLRAISFAGFGGGWGQGRAQLRIGGHTIEDPRVGPGNTLSARDIETGEILWQVGKLPFVQKCFENIRDDFEQDVAQRRKKVPRNNSGGDVAEANAQNDAEDERPDREFSDEEQFLGETWFLGVPLPLNDCLYVMGENAGLLRLVVLKADDGKLIRQIPLAIPPSSLESDPRRKFFGLFPSAAEGILLCPTGLGMVMAFDATTATPLWCFSYLNPTAEEDRSNRPFPFRVPLGNFERTAQGGGWQSPSIRIADDRILLAPVDDPSLYCLDLKTGRLLWKNSTFHKNNSLYVACIRDRKAFVVTPRTVLSVDMVTGKSSVEDETGTFPPHISFPAPFRPAGTGVQNGSQYFIPLSGSAMGVVDLDNGSLEIVSSGKSSVVREQTGEPVWTSDLALDEPFTGEREGLTRLTASATSLSSQNTPHALAMGNLVGLRGKFFTQSLAEIACFDQRDPLERSARALLEARPDDPEGLVKLGRIQRAEEKIEEAIELFRKAKNADSEVAADFLRQTLLEALRNDYEKWNTNAAELEALAEFPEELGEILYVTVRGALQTGDEETVMAAMRKAFQLATEHAVQVTVEPGYAAQLHLALGNLLATEKHSPLGLNINAVTEAIAQDMTGLSQQRRAGHATFPQSGNDEPLFLNAEARCRQIFSELFQNFPAAGQANAFLAEYFVRNRLFTALEQKINLPVDWNLSFVMPSATSLTKDGSETDVLHLAEFSKVSDAFDSLYYDRYGGRDFASASDSPKIKRQLEREQAAKTWPTGQVVLEDRTQSSPETGPYSPREQAVAAILRSARQQDQRGLGVPAANRRSIPLLGSYEPFLSLCSFTLETPFQDSSLICCDSLGRERWRCPVPPSAQDAPPYGYVSETQVFGNRPLDLTVYLKGCNHLLVFVWENRLMAVDTFGGNPNEEPKVLWTKTLQHPVSCRQNSGARPLSSLQTSDQPLFPAEALFVGPNIICYIESGRAVGLDPFTGGECWSRTLESEPCSILGDRENLFLVFPEKSHAMALDPRSGRELESGTIPAGGVFVFETNIVFARQLSPQESKGNSQPYRLHAADLRDLFQKRRRALLLTEENADGEIPTIPTYPIRTGLTHDAMVRPIHHGRFLASVSWTGKTLQVYDLETKRDVLGPIDGQGRRVGVKLPAMTLKEALRRQDCDFDMEVLGDRFLVYYTETGRLNSRYKSEKNENGDPVQRLYRHIPGQATQSIGTGLMMLYDTDGSPAWPDPVRINDWCRVLQTPRDLPVAVFAANVHEQQQMGPGHHRGDTGLWGVNKQTGATSFRYLVPPLRNSPQTPLQGFRIEADPWEKTLTFVAPQRTVVAKFMDEKTRPKKENKEKKTNPNPFDWMFDSFAIK